MCLGQDSMWKTLGTVNTDQPSTPMSKYSICYSNIFLSLCIPAYILYRKYAFDSLYSPVLLRATLYTFLQYPCSTRVGDLVIIFLRSQ